MVMIYQEEASGETQEGLSASVFPQPLFAAHVSLDTVQDPFMIFCQKRYF